MYENPFLDSALKEDPREALIKLDEASKKDPLYLGKAYQDNQPKARKSAAHRGIETVSNHVCIFVACRYCCTVLQLRRSKRSSRRNKRDYCSSGWKD